MPATVTLGSTALSGAVGPSELLIKVASTTGLTPGTRLFVDKEMMTVVSLSVDPWVNVQRGRDGTAASAHDDGATIYYGPADQFYSSDPIGSPPAAIPVSPYINVVNGTVWFAQGDPLPDRGSVRWWQAQTSTYDKGPLGVRTTVLSPTSST